MKGPPWLLRIVETVVLCLYVLFLYTLKLCAAVAYVSVRVLNLINSLCRRSGLIRARCLRTFSTPSMLPEADVSAGYRSSRSAKDLLTAAELQCGVRGSLEPAGDDDGLGWKTDAVVHLTACCTQSAAEHLHNQPEHGKVFDANVHRESAVVVTPDGVCFVVRDCLGTCAPARTYTPDALARQGTSTPHAYMEWLMSALLFWVARTPGQQAFGSALLVQTHSCLCASGWRNVTHLRSAKQLPDRQLANLTSHMDIYGHVRASAASAPHNAVAGRLGQRFRSLPAVM